MSTSERCELRAICGAAGDKFTPETSDKSFGPRCCTIVRVNEHEMVTLAAQNRLQDDRMHAQQTLVMAEG